MNGSRRAAVRRGLFVASATLVGLALCTFDHAANITFGVDLTLTFVQAKKEGTNVTVDAKIPAGVKSELFRAYGSKYKSYTYVKTDERMAHMSRNEEYDLGNDNKLTVRVTGYKQLWIMFLVTRSGGGAEAFKISHGNYRSLNCGPEPDPLIVVINAKIVQVQN